VRCRRPGFGGERHGSRRGEAASLKGRLRWLTPWPAISRCRILRSQIDSAGLDMDVKQIPECPGLSSLVNKREFWLFLGWMTRPRQFVGCTTSDTAAASRSTPSFRKSGGRPARWMEPGAGVREAEALFKLRVTAGLASPEPRQVFKVHVRIQEHSIWEFWVWSETGVCDGWPKRQPPDPQ
jgi:hypothetical protein